jgi:L-alanine-DL-glutamate epimerase and related enzymes of enolase superfamily
MEVKVFTRKLELRNPFTIAHGSYAFRENVFLWIGEGEARAMGEAPVVPYYGYTAVEVQRDLEEGMARLAGRLELRRDLLEAPVDALCDIASGAFALATCRAAFQAAALGLRSAASGKGVGELLGLKAGAAPPSSFTVAYNEDPEAMAKVAATSGFTRLKVKAGIPGDVERIALLRERLPSAIIRVDANQGWTLAEAPAKLAALRELGVELVEEPSACSPAELEALAASTDLPILIDESARGLEDVRRYAKEAPSVAGIVVKTAKNGGPAASLELLRAAREEGMEAMLSCMVESSLGAASALCLAPSCAWLDLDSPLLIANDPFTGFFYEAEAPLLAPGGIEPGPALAAYVEGLPPIVEEA